MEWTCLCTLARVPYKIVKKGLPNKRSNRNLFEIGCKGSAFIARGQKWEIHIPAGEKMATNYPLEQNQGLAL